MNLKTTGIKGWILAAGIMGPRPVLTPDKAVQNIKKVSFYFQMFPCHCCQWCLKKAVVVWCGWSMYFSKQNIQPNIQLFLHFIDFFNLKITLNQSNE